MLSLDQRLTRLAIYNLRPSTYKQTTPSLLDQSKPHAYIQLSQAKRPFGVRGKLLTDALRVGVFKNGRQVSANLRQHLPSNRTRSDVTQSETKNSLLGHSKTYSTTSSATYPHTHSPALSLSPDQRCLAISSDTRRRASATA